MPTELEKEIYTRLLKGILAIESIPFPEGTTGDLSQASGLTAGHQLDTVVRQHLWLGGFDYPGIETGHGVSHGLGTIRGGVSISSTKEGDSFGLKEGMTVSIGNLIPALILTFRSWNLPAISSWHSIEKRLSCTHPSDAPVYSIASDFGDSAQVFETGSFELPSLSAEDDKGDVGH